MYNYATALSHICLAGVSLVALSRQDRIEELEQIQSLCFAFIVFNSLIGIWRYGNPMYGQNAKNLYKIATKLQILFSLPWLIFLISFSQTNLWELSIIYPCLSLVPLAIHLTYKPCQKLENVLLGLDTLVLVLLGLSGENYWAVAAAIAHAFAHFFVQSDQMFNFHEQLSIQEYSIPRLDFYNYALCFYVMFAIQALNNTS